MSLPLQSQVTEINCRSGSSRSNASKGVYETLVGMIVESIFEK